VLLKVGYDVFDIEPFVVYLHLSTEMLPLRPLVRTHCAARLL
jgi:hypothetical protein